MLLQAYNVSIALIVCLIVLYISEGSAPLFRVAKIKITHMSKYPLT